MKKILATILSLLTVLSACMALCACNPPKLTMEEIVGTYQLKTRIVSEEDSKKEITVNDVIGNKYYLIEYLIFDGENAYYVINDSITSPSCFKLNVTPIYDIDNKHVTQIKLVGGYNNVYNLTVSKNKVPVLNFSGNAFHYGETNSVYSTRGSFVKVSNDTDLSFVNSIFSTSVIGGFTAIDGSYQRLNRTYEFLDKKTGNADIICKYVKFDAYSRTATAYIATTDYKIYVETANIELGDVNEDGSFSITVGEIKTSRFSDETGPTTFAKKTTYLFTSVGTFELASLPSKLAGAIALDLSGSIKDTLDERISAYKESSDNDGDLA